MPVSASPISAASGRTGRNRSEGDHSSLSIRSRPTSSGGATAPLGWIVVARRVVKHDRGNHVTWRCRVGVTNTDMSRWRMMPPCRFGGSTETEQKARHQNRQGQHRTHGFSSEWSVPMLRWRSCRAAAIGNDFKIVQIRANGLWIVVLPKAALALVWWQKFSFSLAAKVWFVARASKDLTTKTTLES
jgi:hypothetical protein